MKILLSILCVCLLAALIGQTEQVTALQAENKMLRERVPDVLVRTHDCPNEDKYGSCPEGMTCPCVGPMPLPE